MKTLLAGFLSHIQSSTTKMAMYYRVERTDAMVFGFNDSDRDISIGGLTYYASSGLSLSTVQNTDGFNVSSIDAQIFLTVSTESAIEAGIWDNAAVLIFEARWDSPPATLDTQQIIVLKDGYLGRVDRQNLRFVAEVQDKKSRLDLRIGRVFTPTCPWRSAVWNGTTFVPEAVCNADLTSHIHTGTVTSVGSDPRMIFSASAQAEAAGYYNEGIVAFTSGPNAGLGMLSSMDIRRYENQQFLLHRPLPYAVAVGNTFTAVRGDNKTFQTCQTVFDNAANFGGFPYLPGIDKVQENMLLKVPLPARPGPPDGNPRYDAGIAGTDAAEGGSADSSAGSDPADGPSE